MRKKSISKQYQSTKWNWVYFLCVLPYYSCNRKITGGDFKCKTIIRMITTSLTTAQTIPETARTARTVRTARKIQIPERTTRKITKAISK